MKRNIPPKRGYHYAVPIRCGKLQFPAHGPNVLKKKGVLGKAGNYFSKETKEELTLLVKLSTEKADMNGLQKVYDEQKFLWTWDSETCDDIEGFLRSVPEGMCRHTQEEALKKPEDRKVVNSHLGICRRTECADYLGVTDLLMRYLKQSLTPSERDERYKFLINKFKPTKEMVLFDRDEHVIHNNSFIVGGINKKTIRHLGNSNGTKLWVFELLLSENSKLEQIKNLARPIMLNGRRNTVQRNFVMRYFASTSKDSITDWWKDINVHVKGQIDISYSDRNKQACNENLLKKGMVAKTPAFKTNAEVECYANENFVLEYGESPEVIKTKIQTPLSLDQLKAYLIQTENCDASKKYLDSYILGTADESGSSLGVKNMKYFVEPPNKPGKVLEKYGNNTQTMIVQATTKSELGGNLLSSFLSPEIRDNVIVKGITGFFSSFGLVAQDSPSTSFARYFNLEKKYFLHDDNKGFSVLYSSTNDTNFVGALSKGSATEAVVDNIILNVEKLKKDLPHVSYNGKDYNRQNTSKADYETLVTVAEVKKNIAQMFPGKHAIKSATMEQLTAKLNKGTKEEVRLAVLRYVNVIVKNRKNLQCSNDPIMIRLLLDVIEETCKTTASHTVFNCGVKILLKFLSLKTCVDENGKKKKVSYTPNELNIVTSTINSYVSIVAALCEANKYTSFSTDVLKHAFKLFEAILVKDKALPKVIVKAAKTVYEIAEKLQSFNKGRKLEDHCEVEEKTKNLKSFLTLIANAEKHQKQKTVIEQLNKDIAEFEKNRSLAVRTKIEATVVPYLEKSTLKWRDLSYNVTKGHVVFTQFIKKEKVVVYATLEGILKETKQIVQSAHEFTFVESSGEIISRNKTPVTMKESTVDTVVQEVNRLCTEVFNGQKALRNNEIKEQLEKMLNTFTQLEEPAQCVVSLTVKAQPSKLYGKDILKKKPYLGNQWGKSMVDGLSLGLKEFHSAIGSDVNLTLV